MKYLFLLLLVGCTSKVREVDQVCHLSCTECKHVELKCDTTQTTDDKKLGQ